MQRVMIHLCANSNGDKFVFWRPLFRFATSNQVRPWTSHCIFDHIRYKRTENNADSETEYSNVYSMGVGAGNDRPQQNDS